MDQSTLEYAKNFLNDFIASGIVGLGIGYIHKDRFTDNPKMKRLGYVKMTRLGYATIYTIMKDPITVAISYLGSGSNTNILESTKGDMADIFGFYIGLHIGNISRIAVEGLKKYKKNNPIGD